MPAALAYVEVSFFDSSYALLGGPFSAGLVLDANPSTWEQISVTATEPLNTKYVLSQVLYDNSTLLDITGVIDPGYVNSARH